MGKTWSSEGEIITLFKNHEKKAKKRRKLFKHYFWLWSLKPTKNSIPVDFAGAKFNCLYEIMYVIVY